MACGRLELGLWPCGCLNRMVTGPVAVLSKIALDEDGVRDNNDRITLLIAITLG